MEIYPRLQFMDLLQFLHHLLSSVVRIMIKEIPMNAAAQQDKVLLKGTRRRRSFFTDLSLII